VIHSNSFGSRIFFELLKWGLPLGGIGEIGGGSSDSLSVSLAPTGGGLRFDGSGRVSVVALQVWSGEREVMCSGLGSLEAGLRSVLLDFSARDCGLLTFRIVPGDALLREEQLT
jgi:hypothetical protein